MKTIFSISILAYFFLGSLVLPQGDFSVLPQLPKMYDHCKLNEDADLNLVDFVFDHLMGIDGSFDKHDGGDEEKPHSTTPFQHKEHQLVFNLSQGLTVLFISACKNIFPGYTVSDFCPEEFVHGIFHPPSL